MTKVSVAIATGPHPFPFRTRKLSLSAPMVLGWIRPGRVGRRRISRNKGLDFSRAPCSSFCPWCFRCPQAKGFGRSVGLADPGSLARLFPCPRVLRLRRAHRPGPRQLAHRRADHRRGGPATPRVSRLVLRLRSPCRRDGLLFAPSPTAVGRRRTHAG